MTETLHSPPSSTTPEFNAGAFTISHFSDSPEGFEFTTNQSIGRTEAIDNTDHMLDIEQRRSLAMAMQREMRFNGVDTVREAREAWKHAAAENANPSEVARLRDEFDTVRQGYMNRGKKIGFRAISLAEGNVLSADVQIVPFPVYDLFANSETSEELQDFSSASGVAMVLRTSDDRFVIQHRAVEKQKIYESGRTRGNASYTDIPGASVAGMVDAKLSWGGDRKPGTPDPVDTAFGKYSQRGRRGTWTCTK
jgi:hypothetical protein